MLYGRCQYLDGGLSNAILVDGWQALVRSQREALSSIVDVHRRKRKTGILAMVAVNLFGFCRDIGTVL